MSEPAMGPGDCDVCAGRMTLEEVRDKPKAVTCSRHFLETLDAPYAVQRSVVHRQYGKERGGHD